MLQFRKLGRDLSEVEAWVHTHRGPNPEDMTSLNTEEATKCLVCPRCSSLHCFHLLLFCIILYFANSHNKFLYGQETYKATVIELNGPEFDWLHSPLDVRALYQCSCGRQHGKWATFNGTVNDSEVLPQLKGSHASAMAARRQRQQEEEQLRKEARDSRLAKEYAQTMMEWGRMVQDRDEKIQKFMEVRSDTDSWTLILWQFQHNNDIHHISSNLQSMAMHCGMPLEAVPSPLPPPPPTYVVSPSPNPSPDNVSLMKSSLHTCQVHFV